MSEVISPGKHFLLVLIRTFFSSEDVSIPFLLLYSNVRSILTIFSHHVLIMNKKRQKKQNDEMNINLTSDRLVT